MTPPTTVYLRWYVPSTIRQGSLADFGNDAEFAMAIVASVAALGMPMRGETAALSLDAKSQTATVSTSECADCGVSRTDGTWNCCSVGGSWHGTCGNGMAHTLVEGWNACNSDASSSEHERLASEMPGHPVAEEPASDLPPLVVLLAGQSNMVGYGFTQELDAAAYARIMSVADRVELIQEASSCNNSIAAYDERILAFRRNLSEVAAPAQRFGPELFLGLKLAEATGRRVMMVKRAFPSASLALSWNVRFDEQPAVPRFPKCAENGWEADSHSLYVDLLSDLASAQELIRGRFGGREGELVGMVWLHGEKDSMYEPFASSYSNNLRDLITALRNDTGAEDLPVVTAEHVEASGGRFSDVVVEATRALADSLPRVAFLPNLKDERSSMYLPTFGERKAAQQALASQGESNESTCAIPALCQFNTLRPALPLSMKNAFVHYDTEAQLRLGLRFAHTLLQLMGGSQWIAQNAEADHEGYSTEQRFDEGFGREEREHAGGLYPLIYGLLSTQRNPLIEPEEPAYVSDARWMKVPEK